MITNHGAAKLLERIIRSSLDVSLHDGDPGTTGANELSGSGYARQALDTWRGPQSMNASSNEVLSFTTASVTVTHLGLWRGATFIWGVALDDAVASTGSVVVPASDLILLILSS